MRKPNQGVRRTPTLDHTSKKMRILVDLTHPADAHFFARPIRNWRNDGHEVRLVARDKDILLPLLERMGAGHVRLGRAGRGLLGLSGELLRRQWSLAALMRAERPDVVTGFGGTFVTPPAWLLGVRRIVFTDTESARVSNAITFPFSSLICTPRCYPRRVRQPHLRYRGYKELAYLHPRYFTPDAQALSAAGLRKGEDFVFMRLVGWGSGHDFFHHGLTDLPGAVARLERRARVVLSAEGRLPSELEPLRFRGPLEQVHHLLAFARLYLGESATMGAEAAVLGTPAIVASTSRRSYIDELAERYQLVHFEGDPHTGQRRALERAETLLDDPATPAVWSARRAHMLAEQEDVADFVTDVVLGRRA